MFGIAMPLVFLTMVNRMLHCMDDGAGTQKKAGFEERVRHHMEHAG